MNFVSTAKVCKHLLGLAARNNGSNVKAGFIFAKFYILIGCYRLAQQTLTHFMPLISFDTP